MRLIKLIFIFIPLQFYLHASDIKIVCVGDSIVSRASQISQPGQYGWGETLQRFLNDNVEVINLAHGGRSSKSYIEEGLWEIAKQEVADFYLIEFGHNDQKFDDPSRYTDPSTTFKEYLKIYILESRSIGATPVLVAPFVRRVYHDKRISTSLEPYAKSMSEVASEENVLFIDTYTISRNYYNLIGEDESLAYGDTDSDRSHFSLMGAVWASKWITYSIRESSHNSVSSLIEHISVVVPEFDFGPSPSNQVIIEVSTDLLDWKEYLEVSTEHSAELKVPFWIEHRESAFLRLSY